MCRWQSALALGCLVTIAGCSGAKDEPDPAQTAAAESKLKVALLTPSPISDAGWSAMAYEGLKAVEKELGAEVRNQEAKSAQIPDAMRSYAQKGFRIVFGHGYEYNEPSIRVAKDFPETVFVSSSGGHTADNVGAFRFALEEGFFLAGMAAAKLSKSGAVGMVGGDDVPSIRSTFKAFAAGAWSVNPEIKVREVFTGSGSDSAAAKRATLQLIEEGADCIIHQANAAAKGVFDACEEKGVMAFGANSDQNSVSPAIVASAVIVAGPAFLELAREVQSGNYKGRIQLMQMGSGAIDFVWNPLWTERIPAEVLDLIAKSKADISAAKLSVPMDEF